ncbi:hypothetical protein chiPu_0030377 [Chiloscyllium punctatum]|uniref:Uncharacterized protein n=1 Tax=Chiloscyllium punctatum TaxID=137246 RepID=A0A401TUG6_CHIPU|nr:hypothetical protein [Chiloscyllium punctatum]
MDFRIAIDLRGRRLEDLCLHALGKTKHVDGAVNAGLGGLHRIELVMNRRSRTRQIVDLVHLDIERERDVVAHDLEPGIADQMRNVGPAAGEVIVDAEHIVALLDEPLAQM